MQIYQRTYAKTRIFITLLLQIFSLLSEEKKIVYCFTNYNEQSFMQEKEDFFKKIFEPEYVVKYTGTTKNLKNYAYIVTLEIPHNASEYKALFKYPKDKVLLFSFEGQIVHPLSHEPSYHACYSKIFTWNDDLIDNKRYFKVLFPFSDPLAQDDTRFVDFDDKKLCVLMGTNNVYQNPIENYSGRVDIINFFEKIPEDVFDFYGYGWSTAYRNWKGFVPWDHTKNNESWTHFTYARRFEKIIIIRKYKFDIVYENCKDQNGYLTERIFDSFAAGCVPIYWGSKNIHNYIPLSCLIMRNSFKNNDELYDFIKNMKSEEYNEYQKNIKTFLESKEIETLRTDFFIKHVKSVLAL